MAVFASSVYVHQCGGSMVMKAFMLFYSYPRAVLIRSNSGGDLSVGGADRDQQTECPNFSVAR